jgi:hypothetical protein
MNAKSVVYAVILIAAFSTLLINPSSASSIMVFAPLNYPSPNFVWWGQWASGGASLATIDQFTGYTVLDANPGLAPSGLALSWFSTDLYNFNGSTQTGSVHFTNWLNYTISGLAGFRVYLWTFRWKTGTIPQLWTSVWFDGMPGSRVKCADVGINPYDKSWPSGIMFEWTNGYYYMSRVLIKAIALTNSRAVTQQAKYDEVVWNTYTSSPGPHFEVAPPPPTISGYQNPPEGPPGTVVTLNGTRFAANVLVYIYFDDSIVAKSTTDSYGNFTTTYVVPLTSSKGPHVIKAIDALENIGMDFFDVFTVAPPIVADVNGDGKTDIIDLLITAKNFGKTDPNVDPPGIAGATDISVRMPALASIAAASVGLVRLRKKKNNRTK